MGAAALFVMTISDNGCRGVCCCLWCMLCWPMERCGTMWHISAAVSHKQVAPLPLGRTMAMLNCRGGGGVAVRGGTNPIAINCGKFAGNCEPLRTSTPPPPCSGSTYTRQHAAHAVLISPPSTSHSRPEAAPLRLEGGGGLCLLLQAPPPAAARPFPKCAPHRPQVLGHRMTGELLHTRMQCPCQTPDAHWPRAPRVSAVVSPSMCSRRPFGRAAHAAVLFLYGALDSHPVFPSHVASGRCVLSAAAAGAPAGVVSAFAEPSGRCAGAVRDVAGCAVCASAAPNNWRIEAGWLPPPPPPPKARVSPTAAHL